MTVNVVVHYLENQIEVYREYPCDVYENGIYTEKESRMYSVRALDKS